MDVYVGMDGEDPVAVFDEHEDALDWALEGEDRWVRSVERKTYTREPKIIYVATRNTMPEKAFGSREKAHQWCREKSAHRSGLSAYDFYSVCAMEIEG